MNILLTSSIESFFKLIGVLIIFIFVLAITYFSTRWMSGYQKTHSVNKNLRVIESMRIMNNKYICIVEAGTKYLVVSVGKDEIHPLAELTEEQLKDFSVLEQKPDMMQESFQQILSKIKDKLPKKQD